MAKPELGTKRACLDCGVKFYDLDRDPILCPKCGSVFEVAGHLTTPTPTPTPAPKAADDDDDDDDDVAGGPEVISLEDADKEQGAEDDIPDLGDDDDVEDIGDTDDDTFLEEDDDDENVPGFIADVGSSNDDDA